MAEHHPNDEDDRILLYALRSAEDLEGPFQELYRRYRHRLLRFFARRGISSESARELSQEAFLRVYKSRRSFRGDIPLSSWIFQIAANLARNELRRRHAGKRSGQEKSIDDELESQPIEAHTGGEEVSSLLASEPLARALAKEQLESLQTALLDLPSQMRRTLQMSIYHEYSVAQIAVVMKVSPSTVKVQLHQGRKRLRQALMDRFGDLSF